MATYARINKDGIPMHKHEPYSYWQWPWEKHQKGQHLHATHEADKPIWMDVNGKHRTVPTQEMIDLYNKSLEGDIRDGSKTTGKDTGADKKTPGSKYKLQRK